MKLGPGGIPRAQGREAGPAGPGRVFPRGASNPSQRGWTPRRIPGQAVVQEGPAGAGVDLPGVPDTWSDWSRTKESGSKRESGSGRNREPGEESWPGLRTRACTAGRCMLNRRPRTSGGGPGKRRRVVAGNRQTPQGVDPPSKPDAQHVTGGRPRPGGGGPRTQVVQPCESRLAPGRRVMTRAQQESTTGKHRRKAPQESTAGKRREPDLKPSRLQQQGRTRMERMSEAEVQSTPTQAGVADQHPGIAG